MAEIPTKIIVKLERREFNKGIREAKRDVRGLIFEMKKARKQLKKLVKMMKGISKK